MNNDRWDQPERWLGEGLSKLGESIFGAAVSLSIAGVIITIIVIYR
jgi:hypothetical protein